MTRRDGNNDGGKPRSRKAPNKPGPLSEEDHELWQHAAASLDPLRRGKPRVPVGTRPQEGAAPRQQPAPQLETKAVAHRAPAARAPAVRPAHEPPPLAQFERKRSRRIATGQIAIDARLDLHGARQNEAYVRFRAFLLDCAAQGYSTVLVVTGKGGRRETSGHDLAHPYAAPERGILRRSVPLWLEESDLRAIVTSYTAAGIKHGGEGALYIRLRKRMPPGRHRDSR